MCDSVCVSRCARSKSFRTASMRTDLSAQMPGISSSSPPTVLPSITIGLILSVASVEVSVIFTSTLRTLHLASLESGLLYAVSNFELALRTVSS